MQKEISWVVQNNLSSDRKTYIDMVNAFIKHNIPYQLIDVIPFDDKLPEFNRNNFNIFYGSTTFMNNIYKDKELRNGLFFNPETFRIDNYLQKWGKRMLNSDGKITTFKNLQNLNFKEEELLFIRPLDDSKIFDGQLITFNEIKNWKNKIRVIKDSVLTEDTEILIGEPYKLNKEWRNFIVNGKVIASSRYTKNGILSKDGTDTPQDMIEFCELSCNIYTPHNVFVMDVTETGGEYYIVECGCINSTGFYNANIESIIVSLTNYVKENN